MNSENKVNQVVGSLVDAGEINILLTFGVRFDSLILF